MVTRQEPLPFSGGTYGRFGPRHWPRSSTPSTPLFRTRGCLFPIARRENKPLIWLTKKVHRPATASRPAEVVRVPIRFGSDTMFELISGKVRRLCAENVRLGYRMGRGFGDGLTLVTIDLGDLSAPGLQLPATSWTVDTRRSAHSVRHNRWPLPRDWCRRILGSSAQRRQLATRVSRGATAFRGRSLML